MAQELLPFDVWFDWGDRTPPYSGPDDLVTRWAQVLDFSYGGASLVSPIDGRITMDNRDGRFTPRGKSLWYPREVLTSPHLFKVTIEGEPDNILVEGLVQRAAAQDSTTQLVVFTITAITTRNLDVQPRYLAPTGTDSLLYLDKIAESAGTTVDRRRAQRPPTNIEGVQQWPPVPPVGVQDVTANFPLTDAVADWTAWCNQPVYVLRDGRIGTAHPRDISNPNKKIISSNDLIISGEPALRPAHDEAPELINNVVIVAGYDDLTGIVVRGIPNVPRIATIGPNERNAVIFSWDPADRATSYVPSINGVNFPETGALSYRFESLQPDRAVPLSPGTTYTVGIFARNSIGDSGSDFDRATTTVIMTPPPAPPQPPTVPSDLRLAQSTLGPGGDYTFTILWTPGLDTPTTDLATSYDYRWGPAGPALGAWTSTFSPSFVATTTASEIVVQVRSRNEVDVSREISGVFNLEELSTEIAICEVPGSVTLTRSGTTATVTWSGHRLAELYNVQFRVAENNANFVRDLGWQRVDSVQSGNALTATRVGIDAADRVQARVQAACPGNLGNSGWVNSNEIGGGTTPLVAPTLRAGTAATRDSFGIAWDTTEPTPADIGGWEYSLNAGDWTPMGVAGSARAFTFTGRPSETPHSVIIRATPANIATHTRSPASNPITITTLRDTRGAPGAPSVLVAESTRSVIFSWTPASGTGNTATSYLRYRWRPSTGAWSSLVRTTGAGLFSVPSPRAGVTYEFEITAYNTLDTPHPNAPVEREGALDIGVLPPGPIRVVGVYLAPTEVGFDFRPPLETPTASPATYYEQSSNGTTFSRFTPTTTAAGTLRLLVTGRSGDSITRWIRARNTSPTPGPDRRFGPFTLPQPPVGPPSRPTVSGRKSATEPTTTAIFTLTPVAATATGGDTVGFEVSTTGTGGWQKVPLGTTEFSVVVPEATPAPTVQRYFRAYNVNAAGTEQFSPPPHNSASVTLDAPAVPPPPPPLPLAPRVEGITGYDTTSVRWRLHRRSPATSGAETYQVANTSAGPWRAVTDAEPGAIWTTHDETVTASASPVAVTRWFRAVNSVGNSTPPHPSASSIPQSTAPPSLAAPTLNFVSSTINSINLSHFAVAGAEAYQLRSISTAIARQFNRSIDNVSWGQPTTDITPTLSNLSQNTEYQIQVRAIFPRNPTDIQNPTVASPASNTVTASTQISTVNPVRNLRITERNDDDLLVSFNPPLSVVGILRGYQVRVDGGSWSSIFASTTRRVTGLTPGTEYDIEVRVVTTSGESAPVEVTGSTLLANPVVSEITAGIDQIMASVATLPSGATGLRIRGGSIVSAFSIVADNVAPYSLLWAGLNSGQRYANLAVQAFSATNESGWTTLTATTTTDITSSFMMAMNSSGTFTDDDYRQGTIVPATIGYTPINTNAPASSGYFGILYPAAWGALLGITDTVGTGLTSSSTVEVEYRGIRTIGGVRMAQYVSPSSISSFAFADNRISLLFGITRIGITTKATSTATRVAVLGSTFIAIAPSIVVVAVPVGIAGLASSYTIVVGGSVITAYGTLTLGAASLIGSAIVALSVLSGLIAQLNFRSKPPLTEVGAGSKFGLGNQVSSTGTSGQQVQILIPAGSGFLNSIYNVNLGQEEFDNFTLQDEVIFINGILFLQYINDFHAGYNTNTIWRLGWQ